MAYHVGRTEDAHVLGKEKLGDRGGKGGRTHQPEDSAVEGFPVPEQKPEGREKEKGDDVFTHDLEGRQSRAFDKAGREAAGKNREKQGLLPVRRRASTISF